MSDEFKVALPKPQPWLRFWARNIDYLLFSMIASCLLISYDPHWIHQIQSWLFALMTTLLWGFPEAVCLRLFGTTPGKWVFEIKVIPILSERMTSDLAFSRTRMVLLYGMGLGLGVLSLIMNVVSFFDLRRNQMTSWDRKLGLLVTPGKVRWRRLIGVLLIAFAIGLITVSQLNPQMMEEMMKQSGIPIQNLG